MSSPPPIRRATTADASELARLISLLGYPFGEDEINSRWGSWEAEGNFALVAEAPSSLLGAITLHRMFVLHRPQGVGRITSLIVDPSARGQGIGRALIVAAEAALTGWGCGLLEVTSHTRFSEIYPFYEDLGYERTSVRFAKRLASPETSDG